MEETMAWWRKIHRVKRLLNDFNHLLGWKNLVHDAADWLINDNILENEILHDEIIETIRQADLMNNEELNNSKALNEEGLSCERRN
jgi:hypothetical protein